MPAAGCVLPHIHVPLPYGCVTARLRSPAYTHTRLLPLPRLRGYRVYWFLPLRFAFHVHTFTVAVHHVHGYAVRVGLVTTAFGYCLRFTGCCYVRLRSFCRLPFTVAHAFRVCRLLYYTLRFTAFVRLTVGCLPRLGSFIHTFTLFTVTHWLPHGSRVYLWITLFTFAWIPCHHTVTVSLFVTVTLVVACTFCTFAYHCCTARWFPLPIPHTTRLLLPFALHTLRVRTFYLTFVYVLTRAYITVTHVWFPCRLAFALRFLCRSRTRLPLPHYTGYARCILRLPHGCYTVGFTVTRYLRYRLRFIFTHSAYTLLRLFGLRSTRCDLVILVTTLHTPPYHRYWLVTLVRFAVVIRSIYVLPTFGSVTTFYTAPFTVTFVTYHTDFMPLPDYALRLRLQFCVTVTTFAVLLLRLVTHVVAFYHLLRFTLFTLRHRLYFGWFWIAVATFWFGLFTHVYLPHTVLTPR